MRWFLLIPAALLIVAGVAFASLKALGIDPSLREMLAAAGVCLVAGLLAATPVVLARQASQGAVVQASLVGTLIHLMVSLGCAAVVLIGKVALGPSFVYWLMVFYFTTLIVLVIAIARVVKSAPVEAPKQ